MSQESCAQSGVAAFLLGGDLSAYRTQRYSLRRNQATDYVTARHNLHFRRQESLALVFIFYHVEL